MPGWTIYLDTDNDGVRDLGPQTRSFGNNSPAPLVIPDLATLTSTIDVSGLAGTLVDVNVSLAIQHTWDSDMDVHLISPGGTRVELFTDVGLDGDDFFYTSIDDHALIPIALAGRRLPVRSRQKRHWRSLAARTPTARGPSKSATTKSSTRASCMAGG